MKNLELQTIASIEPCVLPASVTAVRRISTLEELREHLQWAIELEHFTLPPYLCALYSIDPACNREAEEVLRSVVLEEMLHMTLVANLLNAIGGRPRIDSPKMLPGYPSCMPHGDRSFEVPLLPFGSDALEIFLKIERPAPACAPPQSDRYETISQFYEAIQSGLRELCEGFGESAIFRGDPSRQVTGPLFGGDRGRITPIDDLTGALAALEEIVEQGEGADHAEVWDGERDVFHPERDQVAHYYRFEELKRGRRYRRGDTPASGPTGDVIAIDWDGVRNMRANPGSIEYAAGTPIGAAQRAFNQTYCLLLQQLDRTFDGHPKHLASAIGTMFSLKARADALMQLRTGDGVTTAGPSFEYLVREDR